MVCIFHWYTISKTWYAFQIDILLLIHLPSLPLCIGLSPLTYSPPGARLRGSEGTIRCKFRSFLKSPLSNTPKIIYNFCVKIGFNPPLFPLQSPGCPWGGGVQGTLKVKLRSLISPLMKIPEFFGIRFSQTSPSKAWGCLGRGRGASAGGEGDMKN